MKTKMKGILKGGLRYISQMFGPDQTDRKEPELQIGLPTDVKHVAHIGWDGPGPAISSPTWMKEFTSTPELISSSTMVACERILDLPSPARRHNRGAVSGSPGKDSSDFPRSRRRQVTVTKDLPRSKGPRQTPGDSPDAPRVPRRSKKLGLGNGAKDCPSTADSGTGQPTRRRRSKAASGGRGHRSTVTN